MNIRQLGDFIGCKFSGNIHKEPAHHNVFSFKRASVNGHDKRRQRIKNTVLYHGALSRVERHGVKIAAKFLPRNRNADKHAKKYLGDHKHGSDGNRIRPNRRSIIRVGMNFEIHIKKGRHRQYVHCRRRNFGGGQCRRRQHQRHTLP